MAKKSTQKKPISKVVSVNSVPVEVPNIEPKHQEIIDEYFANGFKKVEAVMAVLPHVKLRQTARPIFATLSKRPEVSKYIAIKQLELRDKSTVVPEMIVSELMNIGFSSIAPFLGKSEEEIAKMPHEYTRQISQAETIETKVVNRKGETVTTKKTRIKMKDSQMALRDLSKYIDLFGAHNRSKSPEVDINKLDINTLKVLHDLIQQQKNTIDVKVG